MAKIIIEGDFASSKKIVLGIFVIILGILAGCNTLPIATPISTVLPVEKTKILETPESTVNIDDTPAPTLSNIDSENYVEELLENNMGCFLPCFWGITPGQTSYDDAQILFESLGWMGSESHGSFYTGRDFKDTSLAIRLGIYAPNDVVEKLHIGIGGKDFLNKVKYLSFGNIFKMLGKPTEILVFIGANPGILEPDKTSFEILLFYETQNTLLQFTGTAVKIGDSYHLCPAQPNAESKEVDPLSGNMSLYIGEENQISTPNQLVHPFWNLPNYYISAEKAFGISVDEFYKMVLQSNGNVCFDSALVSWQP